MQPEPSRSVADGPRAPTHGRTAGALPPFPAARPGLELSLVLGRHAALGEAIPVAVAVSIVDDLAAALESATSGRVVGVGQAIIDDAGRAQWDLWPEAPVAALGALLATALRGGLGEAGIPGSARAFVLEAGLLGSVERLRTELRRVFGSPAPRAEVRAWVGRALAPSPVSPESFAPSLAPSVPELASDAPSPVPARISDAGLSRRESLPEDHEPTPSLLPMSDPGPRVRHEPPKRRPVALPTAPPARLGPAPGLGDDGDDSSISLPSEDRGRLIALGLLAGGALALVGWLLGLWP